MALWIALWLAESSHLKTSKENQYHDKQNEDGYNLLAFGRTHNATMSHNNASFESTFGSDMEGSSSMFEASGGF